jgi:hypothetical protein
MQLYERHGVEQTVSTLIDFGGEGARESNPPAPGSPTPTRF